MSAEVKKYSRKLPQGFLRITVIEGVVYITSHINGIKILEYDCALETSALVFCKDGFIPVLYLNKYMFVIKEDEIKPVFKKGKILSLEEIEFIMNENGLEREIIQDSRFYLLECN